MYPNLSAEFSSFSPLSPVRIFASQTPFSEPQKQMLETEMNRFLSQWKTHGAPMVADVRILFDTMLVVAVDEKAVLPSGCSLDSLFRFVLSLEEKHGLRLTDRNLLYFIDTEGKLSNCSYQEINNFDWKDKKVVHLLCQTVGELQQSFIMEPTESPYARLLA